MLFWLGLGLIFSIAYSSLALQQALSGPYVVQDDARQHVFWMQRFLDPELFPNDLIADYFQSIAPWGYTALYRAAAFFGVDPLFFNKLLPPILGLIVTAYLFGVSMRLLPVPAAGFVATLFLNQSLWAKDDLVSATPRAFLYPLFVMFLYYLLRRSLAPCLVAIALQGLFYPTTVFLSIGILVVRLFDWDRWRPRLSSDRRELIFCGAGLAVALVTMGLFASQTSGFGPVVTLSEAGGLPEFFPGGRVAFFEDSAWDFWILGKRSGLRPYSIFSPRIVLVGLLLPLLFYRSRARLRREVTREIRLLPQIVLVSLGMFVAAHLFLFRLHLPGRYTQHSLRIVMALAAGLTLALLADTLFRWAGRSATQRRSLWQLVAVGAVALAGAALIMAPRFERDFPSTRYVVGSAPALYEFFSRQPKETLIASLSEEANNLPSFSRRPILAGSEYALPYHLGYYREIRRRAVDLINAQYSPNLDEVRAFIRKYGVNFFMADRDAWTAEYLENPGGWLRQFQPAASEALARLKEGTRPALARVMPRCSVLETGRWVVIDAKCVSD